MQALSISNPLPAISPVPGAESLLSQSPRQSSPFAALFQANLKADNDVAKLPAAGKATDSHLLGLMISSPVPTAQPLSIPANRTNPDSVPNRNPNAARATAPSPEVFAAPAGAQSLIPAPTVRTNEALVATVPQLVASIASLDSTLVAQIADASTNRSTPSNLPATGPPQGQDSAKPRDAVAAPPNSQNLSSRSARTTVPSVVKIPQPLANVATLASTLLMQIADASTDRSAPSNLPAIGSSRGQDSGKLQDAAAAPPNSQIPSSSRSARTSVPLVVKIPQPVANIATLDPTLVAQIADTTTNRKAPSDLPSTDTSPGQNSAKPQNTVAALSNSQSLSSSPSVQTNVPLVVRDPQLIANLATLDSIRVTQIANTVPDHPAPSNLPSISTPRRPDGTNPQDAVPALPGSQNLNSSSSVPPNVAPVTTVPQPVANIATLDSKLVLQIADTPPERYAPSNLPSTSTPRRPDSAKSPDAVAAPPDAQNISSSPSVATNMPPAAMIPQPALPSAIPDVNFGASIIDAAPNLSAPTHLSSTNAPQGQGTADATQTDPKLAAPRTSGVPTFQAYQRARATSEFLSLQISEVPGNSSVEIPQSPATGDISQSIPKLQTGTATVALSSATHGQTPTKTMPVDASTPTFREALQPLAASVTQPGPAGVTAARSQSQDTSHSAQGNDANTKSDHASNPPVGRTEGKAFVQNLETAGVNMGNAHVESPDSTLVAAAMRTPVDPNATSVDMKPGTGSPAPLAQGQSMPTPAGTDQTVVSSARLLIHPGQSEIRIEMQAGSLGDVELRAHVSGNQVGASIAVEHHDAQVLLANDLPALHNALTEKNLRVDSLSVSQGTSSLTSGGHGSDAGQRGLPQAPPKTFYRAEDESSVQVQEVPSDSLGASNANARLSVLA